MGVTMREVSPIEFPELAGVGLGAKNVEGDGNCLFRALSDQLYGHQHMHKQIRAKVFAYLKENPKDFKPFHNVETEGGVRRNEMRSTRGKGATKLPSSAELDESWRMYLRKLRKPGTWAGQLEVNAFTKAYHMDVKIHLDGTTHAHHNYTKATDDLKAAPRRRIHLAYKNMHYQSVRNMNGPHTGPAKTVAFGELSYKERMDRYKYGCQKPSPALPTLPTTPENSCDPGLAFMQGWDEESEDEKEKKSVAEKGPAVKVDDFQEFPALGSTAKKSTPAPYQNPELLALFSDDPESEEQKRLVFKKPVEKKEVVVEEEEKEPAVKKSVEKNRPVEKKEEEKKEGEEKPAEKKGVARQVVRKPSPSPSPTSSRKRSHEGLSFLDSDSESSDEEEWGLGTVNHGIKRVKLRKNEAFPNLVWKNK
ncbi:OTU-domain-containing protein [Cadophora sp. DSE1049]|nr:OTU-domain-containing protein [Cadophora sp. DSE1049]